MKDDFDEFFELEQESPDPAKSNNVINLEHTVLTFDIDYISQECSSINDNFQKGQNDAVTASFSNIISVYRENQSRIQYLQVPFSLLTNVYIDNHIPEIVTQLIDTQYVPMLVEFMDASINIIPGVAFLFQNLFFKLGSIFIQTEDYNTIVGTLNVITSMINSDVPIRDFPLIDFIAKLEAVTSINHKLLNFFLALIIAFPNDEELNQIIFDHLPASKCFLNSRTSLDILEIMYKNHPNLQIQIRGKYFATIFRIIESKQEVSYYSFKFMLKILNETTVEEICHNIRLPEIIEFANESDEATMDVLTFLIDCFEFYSNDICESDELDCILRGILDDSPINILDKGIELLLKRATLIPPTIMLFSDICNSMSKILESDLFSLQSNFLHLFNLCLDAITAENFEYIHENINFESVLEDFDELLESIQEGNQELYDVVHQKFVDLMNSM